jgi:hypothetical protein
MNEINLNDSPPIETDTVLRQVVKKGTRTGPDVYHALRAALQMQRADLGRH